MQWYISQNLLHALSKLLTTCSQSDQLIRHPYPSTEYWDIPITCCGYFILFHKWQMRLGRFLTGLVIISLGTTLSKLFLREKQGNKFASLLLVGSKWPGSWGCSQWYKWSSISFWLKQGTNSPWCFKHCTLSADLHGNKHMINPIFWHWETHLFVGSR